ncbi:MAG: beta-ketoacyl-[acyl-carrier-protein] synthase II [Proteobacteria bacterium]|nr:MAG: beta-ketoacyl-[acyl-carrier-protein] synthase II [Pseudomonadota bacterium]
MRRVVITGLGMVAPTGNNLRDAWSATVEGQSGISRITHFDASHSKVQIAGEVKNFTPRGILDSKDERRMARFVALATTAAYDAIQDSGLDTSKNAERHGCIIGVGMGGLPEIEENAGILKEKGEKRISPFFIPYSIPNMAAGYVSIAFNLKGPNLCPTTACSSGTHAVGEAFNYIRSGHADAILCGGAESTVCNLGIASFTALKALSTRNDDPATASRPFDKDRDGFVMGEGAGILVLEDLEHAQRRGAKIYAEVVGYGVSGDAGHITAPPERHEGAYRCMALTLKNAGLNLTDVQYINAHGTSTAINDQYESEAIQDLFQDHSKKLMVSSTKGVTGHCLGAAGGLEAVMTALTIYDGVIPPTANYHTPDPACTLDYVPNTARRLKVDVALSNSFGFGGTNATIALRRFS